MYYFRCFFHYFNAGSFRVHSSYLRINKFLLLIPLLYKVNILSSLFIDFYRASKVKNFDFEEEFFSQTKLALALFTFNNSLSLSILPIRVCDHLWTKVNNSTRKRFPLVKRGEEGEKSSKFRPTARSSPNRLSKPLEIVRQPRWQSSPRFCPGDEGGNERGGGVNEAGGL